MKFTDIPQFTSSGNYNVNVGLKYIERALKSYEEDYGLELNPDFQRGNVWTREQQISWLEFYFKGGKTSRIIYFNSPAFAGYISKCELKETVLCIDGLQRLTAILGFLHNEIPVFGTYYNEFEDIIPRDFDLVFNVNNLQTRKEVLQWYVDMNSGGTVHSDDEIERVKQMIELEE